MGIFPELFAVKTASKIVSLFERTVVVIDDMLRSPNEKTFCNTHSQIQSSLAQDRAQSVGFVGLVHELRQGHVIALPSSDCVDWGMFERESLLPDSGSILSSPCTLVI
jgi:hypothetical protein